MSKEKPYNNGTWTEARFRSFIKGGLRSISGRWGPKNSVLKNARVERGKYKCAGYKKRWHIVPVTVVEKGKRVRNIAVDHIDPVIDPVEGFISWDEVVKRMFVEEEGLQVLCKECHSVKTKEERKARSAK